MHWKAEKLLPVQPQLLEDLGNIINFFHRAKQSGINREPKCKIIFGLMAKHPIINNEKGKSDGKVQSEGVTKGDVEDACCRYLFKVLKRLMAPPRSSEASNPSNPDSKSQTP